MAAFCACCGAEIGPKAEACPACGTPQHGMIPKNSREKGSVTANPKRDEEVRIGSCCLI
jgi:predicted amidophosphoribosyltransferase